MKITVYAMNKCFGHEGYVNMVPTLSSILVRARFMLTFNLWLLNFLAMLCLYNYSH